MLAHLRNQESVVSCWGAQGYFMCDTTLFTGLSSVRRSTLLAYLSLPSQARMQHASFVDPQYPDELKSVTILECC